eukprot:Tbor_TRINITY_DN4918_c0_g1::TRINITY_DN4918_c0_g1_i2::g.9757::m.9757
MKWRRGSVSGVSSMGSGVSGNMAPTVHTNHYNDLSRPPSKAVVCSIPYPAADHTSVCPSVVMSTTHANSRNSSPIVHRQHLMAPGDMGNRLLAPCDATEHTSQRKKWIYDISERMKYMASEACDSNPSKVIEAPAFFVENTHNPLVSVEPPGEPIYRTVPTDIVTPKPLQLGTPSTSVSVPLEIPRRNNIQRGTRPRAVTPPITRVCLSNPSSRDTSPNGDSGIARPIRRIVPPVISHITRGK